MHDFYLIKRSKHKMKNFSIFLRDKEQYKDLIVEYIGLEDNLVEYIFDSLTWIPCRNPSLPGMPQDIGFHNIGVTLFEEHSAPCLISILLLGVIY